MTDDWSPFLDREERVIWEGRPRRGLRPWPGLLFSLFGLPFLLGGLVLLRKGIQAVLGLSDVFDLFFLYGGLVLTLVGAGLVFGTWALEATRHRRIGYALSDRRAYIRTGSRVDAVPIRGHAVDITPLPDGSGTILFGPRDMSSTRKTRASFEDIADVRTVAALFPEGPS